jgi:hypothetical protein
VVIQPLRAARGLCAALERLRAVKAKAIKVGTRQRGWSKVSSSTAATRRCSESQVAPNLLVAMRQSVGFVEEHSWAPRRELGAQSECKISPGPHEHGRRGFQAINPAGSGVFAPTGVVNRESFPTAASTRRIGAPPLEREWSPMRCAPPAGYASR